MTVSCDYDPASVYHCTKVKAAKEHQCCECTGTIHRGESHELVKGCWDSRWETFRTCPDCLHLRCELTSAYGEGGCGWLHGGMLDQIRECATYALDYPQGARFVAMFNATSTLRGGPTITLPKEEPEDDID